MSVPGGGINLFPDVVASFLRSQGFNRIGPQSSSRILRARVRTAASQAGVAVFRLV